jgi:tetratricopeptide (TPR) repeat protein
MNWKTTVRHKVSRFPIRMLGDTGRTWNLGSARALARLELVARLHLERFEYNAALPLLEQAVAVRRDLAATDHDQVVKLACSLSNLGRCQRGLARHEEALTTFQEALDTLLTVDCANLGDLAETTEQVIQTLRTLGRYSEALPLQDDLTTLRR